MPLGFGENVRAADAAGCYSFMRFTRSGEAIPVKDPIWTPYLRLDTTRVALRGGPGSRGVWYRTVPATARGRLGQ